MGRTARVPKGDELPNQQQLGEILKALLAAVRLPEDLDSNGARFLAAVHKAFVKYGPDKCVFDRDAYGNRLRLQDFALGHAYDLMYRLLSEVHAGTK